MNVFLAQTFDMVPAREMVVTPFHSIAMYLSITDQHVTIDALKNQGFDSAIVEEAGRILTTATVGY